MAPSDPNRRSTSRGGRGSQIAIAVAVVVAAIVLFFWFADGTGPADDTGAPTTLDDPADPATDPDLEPESTSPVID